ncbi:MAG TPA: hypothetical protein DDZ44_04085, partial [Syntrophomonas wolfei]|nr:hypothetical protein [Syntrophomonas wolfei]
MYGSNSIKYPDSRKILALLALVAAIIAARGAANYLAYLGVTYYVICMMAILINFRWTAHLLWVGVGFHVLLTGYALWSW